MKKTLIAAAGLLALSGAALAQSNVTAFGILDVGLRQIKGQDTISLVQNEGRAQSRLGFRGTEDLGGGLKASFWLETGISVDTGATAGAAFWQRRTTVSLSGDFGELRVGRHKYASRLAIEDFDPSGTAASGMLDYTRLLSGMGSALGTGFPNRANNQVGYHLPTMGGVYGTFDVSAGEGISADKAYSGRLGYRTKALHVAGGYGQFGAANKLKSMSLGASYDFGDFAVSGLYVDNKFGSRQQDLILVGGSAKVGAAGKVFAMYGRSSANAAAKAVTGGDSTYFAVGYDHSLSKRTSLYTTLANVGNDGTARVSVNGTSAAGTDRPIAGGTSRGMEVGIRHNF